MTPSANDAGIGLYVITLASSDLPMSLDVPFRHELVGFTVFRSRSFEHGRERFSLHVGYFESERRAEDALTVVCRHYPQAWIAAAPATNLSSLDNTLNTEFRLLRTAYARVVTPKRATGVEAPTFRRKSGYGAGRSLVTTLRCAAQMVARGDRCSGRSTACDIQGVSPLHRTCAARGLPTALPATRIFR